MWESPVNIFEIHEPIIEEINKQKEETVFKAIHRVGVDVNKEELIRAMQYDRGQYEKGYQDGYAKAIDDVLETLSKYDSILSVIPAADLQGIIYVIEQMKGGAE